MYMTGYSQQMLLDLVLGTVDSGIVNFSTAIQRHTKNGNGTEILDK